MNIFVMLTRNLQDISGKEFYVSVLDMFGISIIAGTRQGSHLRLCLSFWRFQIEIGIHQWKFNITKVNGEME